MNEPGGFPCLGGVEVEAAGVEWFVGVAGAGEGEALAACSLLEAVVD
jgi:hypothetical protein